MKELDAKARLKAKFTKEQENKKETDEEAYAQMVDSENMNRIVGLVEASGIDAAVAALGLGGDEKEPDMHPEKRRATAYAAFEESEIPVLKEECPGLKMSQYKDMLFKKWKKSPMNPMNK